MLNYTVEPASLAPLIPTGTELDLFKGKTYISLVGFRFLRTRLRGVWIPFHSNFDEVNLRFYVKRQSTSLRRRGVVFVREIVPHQAIAMAARWVYHENYMALPMAHRVVEPTSEHGRVQVEYGWRYQGRWNRMRVECSGRPALAEESSLEQFITEHYWGYSGTRDSGCLEYQVAHDPWRIWNTTQASFEGDCSELYGPELAAYLKRAPDSAFLAEGSAVRVYSKSACGTGLEAYPTVRL